MAPKKTAPKKAAPKTYDFSGLEVGMRVQAESDGTYFAAEVVAVSTSKSRARAPVKVSYKGYEGYDEWLGGDRIRSKALKVVVPEKKTEDRPAREAPHLIYFPLAGRGEVIRLIAAVGGVKITESSELPEGCTKDMYLSPGSIPLLKHGDLRMSQSTAIENYVATLAPKFRRLSPKQRAVDQQFACIKEEILGNCAKTIFVTMKADKGQAKKEFTELFDKWLPLLETRVPAEGFVHGGKLPTVADLCVLNITTGYMPFGAAVKHAGYDFGKYPKVMALSERTAKAESVAAFLASSTTAAANPMGL
uniref:Glutathione S-transferase n=1 Tax=Zooxanthella nutricula TaxID=1333877 RepID=A0A7S2J534_9DINO